MTDTSAEEFPVHDGLSPTPVPEDVPAEQHEDPSQLAADGDDVVPGGTEEAPNES